MPRRDWRTILAAGGIALAALANAQPVDRNGGGSPSAQRREQPSVSQKSIRAGAVPDLFNRIASALEVANAKPEPTEDRERSRRDLKAQEDMAKWARWMFYATAASVVFTMVGICLVILNLREARRTTTAAIRGADAAAVSADEARKTTIAALRSAETAEQALHSTQRAFIYTKEIQQDWATNHGKPCLRIQTEISNDGPTPAYRVIIVCSVLTVLNVDEQFSPPSIPVPETAKGTVMGPNAKGTTGSSMFYLADLREIFLGRRKAFYLVRIEYKDLFGEPHHTQDCSQAVVLADPDIAWGRHFQFIKYERNPDFSSAN